MRPRTSAAAPKSYRNPIVLAREWQALLASGQCANRAALARRLGVTRARVTQVLRLLELSPQLIEAVTATGNPLPQPIVTERSLRTLVGLPPEEQPAALHRLLLGVAS